MSTHLHPFTMEVFDRKQISHGTSMVYLHQQTFGNDGSHDA